MRRPTVALLILAFLSPVVMAAKPKSGGKPPTPEQRKASEAAKSPLQSLVTAEQAFAKQAMVRNTRDAFVANFAEDCVIFRPLPVNGHDFYVNRPVSTAKLAWQPVYAEVSASGDLGVTTGPWEYTPPPDQENADVAYGEFFSVWRRSAGQPWKVSLDCGISHPKPDAGVDETPLTAGPVHDVVVAMPESVHAGFLGTFDGAFIRMLRGLNPSQAVLHWTTADLRYLREGDAPRDGDDARNAMSGMPSRCTFHPLGSDIAKSGDLGYTYGVREDSAAIEGHPPDSTVYLHVWRKSDDGAWKMSAVVDHPIQR